MLRILLISLAVAGLPVLAAAQLRRVSVRSVEAEFVFEQLPDNYKALRLTRNNTYQFINWNGWSGEALCDEGIYSITRGSITFTSKASKTECGAVGKKLFAGKVFFIYQWPATGSTITLKRRSRRIYYYSDDDDIEDNPAADRGMLLSSEPVKDEDYTVVKAE